MTEISQTLPETELSENLKLEDAKKIFEEIKAEVENLTSREKWRVFSKKDFPLLQKIENLHRFCGKKWHTIKMKNDRKEWIQLTGKLGFLRERFPIYSLRENLKNDLEKLLEISTKLKDHFRPTKNNSEK